MKTAHSRRMTAGLTLIVVGLGLFFLQRSEGVGEAAVPLILGAVFLVAYLYNRIYGFLVPAGVLLGVGTGRLASQAWSDFGNPLLLCLGAGFLLIYFVSLIYERSAHWWPLIPGSALILSGLPRGWRIFEFLFENWPLVLVLIGVGIVVGAYTRKRPTADTSE